MASNILGPEWNLSPEGLNVVTENGAIKDGKKVLKAALDTDLKTIGKSVLSNELTKSKLLKVVLQIQKIRNISAPKAKEGSQAAPRMLKLTLTDGESYVQAIEVSPINSIGRDKTAPGTKVLISGATVVSGYLLISPLNCTVLGGQVEHLYDKWLLAKSVQESHQHVFNDGAPPWVAFGHKIITGNQEKPFKSLDKSKDQSSDHSEFEQQRQEAIAEAASGAVKKTFGGRVRQNVQPLQNQPYNRGRNNEGKDFGRKGKFSQREVDGEERLLKPSEKVSLFAFLEDKLPVTESKKSFIEPSSQYPRQNYQKETKYQPRNQERYDQGVNRQSTRSQYEKNPSNSYSKSDKSAPQNSFYNNPKTSKNEPKSFGTTVSNQPLPQKQSNSASFNNDSTKTSLNEPNNRNPPLNPVDTNNVKTPQGTQYRNERFLQGNQNPSDHPYPRENFYQNQANQYPRQQYQPHSANPTYQSVPQRSSTNFVPQNSDIQTMTNNLVKMSVNNEFASRSLRQHLNLGPSKRGLGSAGNVNNLSNVNDGLSSLGVGDHCLAKYWEDGKFYNAVITAVTDRTYAVQFTGYGNIEEVLKSDCFASGNAQFSQQNRNQNHLNNQQYSDIAGTLLRIRIGPITRRLESMASTSCPVIGSLGTMEFRRKARN